MDSMAKTTGIGSLPLRDINQALDYSFKHDIPFFPQLFSLHGSMTEQVLNCNFKFLDEFISRAKNQNIKLIKIQLAGPSTTKLDKTYYDNCLSYLKNKLDGVSVLLCIDEPILESTTLEKHLEYSLYSNFNYVAIHSCAKLSKELIDPFLEHIDYFFYDLLLNPELLHVKKLCPGIVDYKGEVSTLNFSHSEIITTTCGLQGSHDIFAIEDIFKKLTSTLN